MAGDGKGRRRHLRDDLLEFLTSARKKWLQDKTVRILLQYGPEKSR